MLTLPKLGSLECACLPQGAALGAGDGREGLTRHDQALHRHYVKKDMFYLTVTFWATNAVRDLVWKKEG